MGYIIAHKSAISKHWLKKHKVFIRDCFSDVNGYLCDCYPEMMKNPARFCWACHIDTSAIQRCHIIPRSKGGTEDLDNLMLLCADCHHNAPSVSFSATPMKEWVRKEICFHEQIFQLRAEVIKEVFSEDPSMAKMNTMPQEFQTLFRKKFTENVDHILETCAELHGGRLSKPTIRAVLIEAVRVTCEQTRYKEGFKESNSGTRMESRQKAVQTPA